MGKSTYSHPGKKMSLPREGHLKAIYQSSEKTPFARSIDLAVHLGASKPSVDSATTALQEEGFIVKPLYGEVCLTGKGQKQGQITIVEFQLIRQLSVRYCNASEQMVNEDVCKMEHLISDETAFALKNVLNKCERSFSNNKELRK